MQTKNVHSSSLERELDREKHLGFSFF